MPVVRPLIDLHLMPHLAASLDKWLGLDPQAASNYPVFQGSAHFLFLLTAGSSHLYLACTALEGSHACTTYDVAPVQGWKRCYQPLWLQLVWLGSACGRMRAGGCCLPSAVFVRPCGRAFHSTWATGAVCFLSARLQVWGKQDRTALCVEGPTASSHSAPCTFDKIEPCSPLVQYFVTPLPAD